MFTAAAFPIPVLIWTPQVDDDRSGYTLSSVSRSRSLTPEVERPAVRSELVSMRMIFPNWPMAMSSMVSSTSWMEGSLLTSRA
jgi:hypothetical protein